MSIFKYLNPLYYLPEDTKVRCGVYFLTLRRPDKDPYIEACRVDDNLTTESGWGEQNLTLERLTQHFQDMITEIQKDFAIGSKDWMLGETYKRLHAKAVWLFFNGAKK